MNGLSVQWTANGQHGSVADWAGDGSGTVVDFSEAKNGFGERPGIGDDHFHHGPAALVRFSGGQKLEAWIPVTELVGVMPVDELEQLNPNAKESAS